MPKTTDFLPEFMDAFKVKLEADAVRWGDTWLKRTRKGQEERTVRSTNDRFDRYLHGGQPLDNLSIIGDCYINWIREQHPEMWTE